MTNVIKYERNSFVKQKIAIETQPPAAAAAAAAVVRQANRGVLACKLTCGGARAGINSSAFSGKAADVQNA